MKTEIKKFFEEYRKNTVQLPVFITKQFKEKTRFNGRGCVGEVICPELIEGYTGEEYIVDKNENKNYWELLPTKEGVTQFVYIIGEWIEINQI